MSGTPPVAYVLSSGRTGTVFLARALSARFDHVHCVHEPPGSRKLIMLGNARNRLGHGTPLVRTLLRRGLDARLRRLPPGASYVEINPMLCPVTDLLPVVEQPLRVVHLVRDPRTWVPSIRRFKASGPRRHVIDHVPLATPFPVPRPPGWWRASHEEQALWRWRYCNEQILAIAPRCDRYALVRYEDLFSSDPGVREDALGRVLDVLELASPEGTPWFRTRERVNAAPEVEGPVVDEAAVREVCGPLLDRLGY